MPLYMDRHDIPGASAADVAQAHVADLAMESKYGVEFLTYWFDPDHGKAFCLAKAPGPESLASVHREAHGLIPGEIISVSEDNVLRFLGDLGNQADDRQLTSSFKTILFTDLEGSTSLLHDVGQAAFMELLGEHDRIIRRALVTSGGREVKHTGDGIMASFDTVESGLRGALAIRDGFAARMASGATPALRVRIGVAAGEPVDRDGDLFGSTVNLASRICDAADAGQILVSDTVRDLAVDFEFLLDDGDTRIVKGFAKPIRVYRLTEQGD